MKPLTPDFVPLSLMLIERTRYKRLSIIKENRKERKKGEVKKASRSKKLLDMLTPEQLKAAGF